MNWLTNRFFRGFPFRSILLIVLLTSITVLLFFGISQYTLSREQFKRSDELYVTTVKLDDSHLESRSSFTRDSYSEWDYSARDPELLIVSGLEEELISFHKTCEEVLAFENRVRLTAMSDELFRLPNYFDMDIENVLSLTGSAGEVSRHVSHETAIQGIVSAKCILLEFIEPSFMRFDPNTGERKMDDMLRYKAYFEIDHSNSELDPVCDEVRYMEMTLYSLDEFGNALFQEDHNYKIAAYGSIGFRFPDNTDALSEIDPKPQYTLLATLIGTSADQRVELIDDDSSSALDLWYENYGLQDIAPEVLEKLPLGFPADKVKTALILPDIYNPIWDLDEELTAEELTRKEKEFDKLIHYIQLPARQFSAIVTKEPELLFEFIDEQIFIRGEIEANSLLAATDEAACLVPIAMAERYGLEVGDTLNFGLLREPSYVSVIERFEIKIDEEEEDIEEEVEDDELGYDRLYHSCQELQNYSFKDYKTYSELPTDSFVIVGMFDNKPIAELKDELNSAEYLGYYHFRDQEVTNNTIIIVDRGEGFSDLPLVVAGESPFSLSENRSGMMSARLKNGSAAKEAYLAGMREAGLDEYIIDIDDHGYSEVERILLDLVADGQRQMYLFVSVAVLLLLFFLVMVWRFYKPELERMYVLGTVHKVRRKTLNSVLVLYWLVSVIIGAALSFLVFRSSLANMALELDLSVSEVAGPISQYVLIFAAVCVLSLIVSLAVGSVMSRRTKER